MFQDVVQTFLDDAIKIHGRVLREKAVHVVQFALENHPAGFGGVVNHRFERAGQAEMIQLVRMEVVRNLAGFGDGLGRELADAFELFAQIGRQVFPGQRQLRAVFDEQQVLAEAVVQFGGDAGAFGFLGRDELQGVFRAGPLFPQHGLRPLRLGAPSVP